MMWPAMLRADQLKYRAFEEDQTKDLHLPREISQVVSDKLDLCNTLKFASLNKLGKTITREKRQNVLRLTNEPFNLATDQICNSTYLFLHSRNISDDHMQILASAIGSGALPKLESLSLFENNIGDAGAAYKKCRKPKSPSKSSLSLFLFFPFSEWVRIAAIS